MQRKVIWFPLTEPAEMFYTQTSVSSFYSSQSLLPDTRPPVTSHPLFPIALSPLPILLHRSSPPHPARTLLCTDQIVSLCPVICFTLIFMKKGGDEEDGLRVEEDNRGEMKEEKTRGGRGEGERRWGGGVGEEAAIKLIEGHSPARNNFLNRF